MNNKNYLDLINESLKSNRILNNYLLNKYDIDEINKWDKISLSIKNTKMGDIFSFSLPPVLTCKNCGDCRKYCYALWHIYKLYKNSEKAYDRNLYLLINNYDLVYQQLSEQIKKIRVFRFNVSGDIFSVDYMNLIINIARENRHCKFLVFTKNYKMINEFINIIKSTKNLKIIFSEWLNTTRAINPYNLPVSNVIFKHDFIKTDNNTFICGDNCFECFCKKQGCFKLKEGEKVLFNLH